MKKYFACSLAALLIAAFCVPAMAEVKIGGIVFTDAFFQFEDKEKTGGTDDITTFNVTVPNISRLNGKWKSDDGKFGLFIELGLRGQGLYRTEGGTSGRDAVVRHAIGNWSPNSMFTMHAGNSTTDFSPLNPSQTMGTCVLNVLGMGYGNLYAGRVPHLRFTLSPVDTFKLSLALVDPDHGHHNLGYNGQTPIIVGYKKDGTPIVGDDETVMPRIDLSASIKAGPVSIYPGISIANKSYANVNPGNEDSFTTYALSLGTKMDFGIVSLAAELNFGENWGNVDYFDMGGAFYPAASGHAGNAFLGKLGGAVSYLDKNLKRQIADSELFAGWLDFAINVKPVQIHLILGLQTCSNDMDASTSADDFEQTTMMYGISAPIVISKHLKIRPEIMIYDFGELENWAAGTGNDPYIDVDKGTRTLAGVQFQFTF